jgi:hypothetical protein
MKLYELAQMIRSKNAGPFMLTLDVLFDTHEKYEKARDCGKLTPENFARLYSVPVESVQMYLLPLANAIKFSIPRPSVSGDFNDRDIYGCQWHAPLVMMDIPD